MYVCSSTAKRIRDREKETQKADPVSKKREEWVRKDLSSERRIKEWEKESESESECLDPGTKQKECEEMDELMK